MTTTEPRLFCPTCLQGRGDMAAWLKFRSKGLDIVAHLPRRYHRVRAGGIVRVRQDVNPAYGPRVDPAGRGSIRLRKNLRVGYPYRSNTAYCVDPWHAEVAKWRGATTTERVERPRTTRPARVDIRARHKARARAHKARQANR